jgi:hypothetical protein
LLLNLQQSLIDPINSESNLVAVQSYVKEKDIKFSQDQLNLFNLIVSRLETKASVAAL